MRIAIFSDMHGNAVALDAVLADLRRAPADRLVCLGDAVQGGPQPREVVARLRALACPVVLGNADDYLLTGADSGAEAMDDARRARMETVRAWSIAQLDAADRAFMRTFSSTVTLDLGDGRRLLCYHGSPRSFDDVILPATPDAEVRALLEPQPNTIYAGGHTHLQFLRHFGRTFHFNPGSVGFAYRHDQGDDPFTLDPFAEYALLTADGDYLGLEFRRVPFDVAALRRAYRESGRPFAADAEAQFD